MFAFSIAKVCLQLEQDLTIDYEAEGKWKLP